MCLRRSSRKDHLGDGLAENYRHEAQVGGNGPQYRAESVHCKGVSTWLGRKCGYPGKWTRDQSSDSGQS